MASNASEYADRLEEKYRAAAASGVLFGFANAYDGSTADDVEDVPGYDADEHDADNLPEDWERASAGDWLSDVLDLRYVVGSNREYRGAHVFVTLGGPNAYLDTTANEIVVGWGFDAVERRPLPVAYSEAIDDYLGEMWETGA